jgi:hypothetical protein
MCSHRTIIIDQVVLPPPTSETASALGEMSARVSYTPADTLTDAQIGNAVERICKRLTKLADD